MQAYAELLSCRREYILRRFGEDPPVRCGSCGNCQNLAAGAERSAGESVQAERPRRPNSAKKRAQPGQDGPFPPHTRVAHNEWGKGIVQECDDSRVVVLFDEAGRKTLSLETVLKNNLLEPAG